MNNIKVNLQKVDKDKVKDKSKKSFDFNNDELNKVLQLYRMGCTDVEVMRKYGMSEHQFYNWKKKPSRVDPERTNRDLIEQAKNDMYLLLYNKAFDLALNKDNVPMLKYVMANKLGWSDKVEQKVDTTQSVSIVNNANEDIELLSDAIKE